MSFSFQSVVSSFEIQYDTFCLQDHEENIFFDYAGVNAEGSSPNTKLRSSWTHLLLLDAILAYTEHKTKTAEMTQSLAFQYHQVLRRSIQTSKRDQNMTRQIELDDHLNVDIPTAWTSLSALQKSLCLDDNTVSDIYEFLVSSPLLGEEGSLQKLITDMVNDVPLSDNKDAQVAPHTTARNVSPSSRASPGMTLSSSVAVSPPVGTNTENIDDIDVGLGSKQEHRLSNRSPQKETINIEWSAVVTTFSKKCETFLSQGHNKVLSDICDVSTHCTPANMHEWLDLLLLDALLCVLLRVATRKRSSTCFNQHRVLRESIQEVVQHQQQLSAFSFPLHSQLQVTASVSYPWENILNFSDQYCHAEVLEPAVLKKLARKMSFKREQARSKVGQRLSECHVFQHMSLKSAVETVIQHLCVGSSSSLASSLLPSFPSAHASQVTANLRLFCRTVLAAAELKQPTISRHDSNIASQQQEAKTEAPPIPSGNSFSLSTFCSSVMELDRHRSAVESTVAKKQRI